MKSAAAAMLPPSAAVIAAAGFWLDSTYHIRSDIAQIRCMKANRDFYQNLCKAHGESDWSFYHTLHSTRGQNDYQEAFVFEGRSWTYAELRGEIGRLAKALQDLGVQNRTVVAMYVNNSPEFMIVWWALYKLGAIPAPVNTSITREPLKHCLRVSEAEFLITTYELFDAVATSLDTAAIVLNDTPSMSYNDTQLPKLKKLINYDYDTYDHVAQSLPELKSNTLKQHHLQPVTPQSADWPIESRPAIRAGDTSQYLFTSGTTGLPKASVWPAAYSMMACGSLRWPLMFQKHRRFYISTPMFHGGAAFAVLPATFATSGTVILARRFSVSNFWKDVRRTRANAMFYIGEMIRFLVQAPPDPHHPDEKASHGLELIYGLGLSAPVIRAFRDRFGVPQIVEYYGSSEGTTSIAHSTLHNGEEGVGKVACWGPLMRSRYFGQDSFYIIRVDLETGEVWRDPKTGLCRQCPFDEVGEAITRVSAPLQRTHDYVGDGGRDATEKKLLRDVFEKGDLFIRMGDAMVMDRNGYVAFRDRLGDTFRAKGHNVSTTEVETAFLHHPYIQSANVYSIPMNKYGYEGQLGCAAITMQQSKADDPAALQALSTLEEWLVKEAGLAPYAVPRFLRVMPGSATDSVGLNGGKDPAGERVSTIMKKLKTGLRSEALDIDLCGPDKLFWIEQEGSGFTPLDTETLMSLLRAGKARL
ncbi:hypothetical protein HRR90_009047 [Exophiala dermatitidis]|nr:hypothetical protein HRR75_008401 [Exophiala dermatitidis]KAJ4503516.1 hypothetical protein HRR73_009141 [Exophiala dermatitidis]KAJ4504118.1 hypothetical protein HRR74_009139 [Exophiala dermatitidis]KAJ4538277.1 hypothetical protein HRR78_008338 [Exophiala dermatitidis]KAJ4555986.1 hypothetical protein HRR79_009077 [Exophiala dermatitidis]